MRVRVAAVFVALGVALAVPVSGWAGQVKVSVTGLKICTKGQITGVDVNRFKQRLRFVVTVRDEGEGGSVKRVELGPSDVREVSVTGPVSVTVSVRYGDRTVLEFSVWPEGVSGASSDVYVGDGRLTVSVRCESRSVREHGRYRDFSVRYGAQTILSTNVGGEISASLFLNVSGEGVRVSAGGSVAPLVKGFLMGVLAVPVLIVAWDVLGPDLSWLVDSLVRDLNCVLAAVGELLSEWLGWAV
jgi:hypothetical protein